MKLPNLRGAKAAPQGKPIKSGPFSRLSMSTRRSISGYLFILPFIIGFMVFMVSPLIMSLQMTFSKVNSETINPNSFEMVSYLGYDNNVVLSKEIDLPETLRYNEDQKKQNVYSVEVVKEVFTLDTSFSYGHTVVLDKQIDLPGNMWYNPTDLKAGKYHVEPLENFAGIPTTFTYGASVVLPEKLNLPKGLQYNKLQQEKGVWAVENAASVLELKSHFTFGPSITLSKSIELPEGYSLAETQPEKGGVTIVANDGKDIPVSFAAYLIDSGNISLLSAPVAAVQGGRAVTIPVGSTYDKELYAQKGEVVIKAPVPASFAAHLIDAGRLDVFGQTAAAAMSKTAEELALPEHFTYDKALMTSKGQLQVLVATADPNAPVPTSFAAYLLDNGYADLFYATVDPVANAKNVCELYRPVYDAQGKLAGFDRDLPMDITYAKEAFAKNNLLNIELSNVTVPASFAGHIISEGGWGMFFGTFLDLIGAENYVHVLSVEPKYNEYLVTEISKMSINTLAILVVAFIVAILLNQEFKGRAFVRAIFFLPVILSSGVLVNLEANNNLMAGIQEMMSEETPFTVTDTMMEILRLTGMGGDLLDIIFDLIAEVYDIVMASGIQIIVFLSGLQNVPASLYEAADVEGCTKWEAFWMITFPLVSPLLIVNIIYTIIDFFTKMESDLSTLLDTRQLELKYDIMSTMAWVYFAVALVLIAVSSLILSKVVATDE